MAEFRTVAKVSEVKPGDLRYIRVDGGPEICLANIDGTFYAIGDSCAHAGGALSEGTLDRTTVTCPLHGATFDMTSGEVQGPPADDSVPRYEVRIQGGDVQVKVE
jgi:nitrite reductase/ring-hydroxylating ferredoxin subunit